MSPRLVLAILFFLLCSLPARADNYATVGFGPSIDGTTNPKVFALGYEKTWGEFSLYTHCGILFESITDPFCAVVPGVHIETPSGIFVRAGFGPAIFANPTDRLSSRGEFNISFALGFYEGPVAFCGEVDHFSNAGLVPPNLGDDHVLAEISVSFP